GAGEWDRIGDVLERAQDADPVERAVLKTVGVLNLLDAPDLPATTESIQASLVPEFDPSDTSQAIERLIVSGLLFRRPGREELRRLGRGSCSRSSRAAGRGRPSPTPIGNGGYRPAAPPLGGEQCTVAS